MTADERLELIREELRLMREIAIYELQCLMNDGADANEIDAKLEEYDLIRARRDSLERYLLGVMKSERTSESPHEARTERT